MNGRMQSRRRIDSWNGAEEWRAFPLYLQSGEIRRKNRLLELEYPVRRRRIIFYCIAGVVLLTGLFFVFF